MSSSESKPSSPSHPGHQATFEEKIRDCIKNKKRQLDLSFCNPPLEKIPDSLVFCSHLEKLYLVFNQISEITPKIKNLSNLKELYLHYNQLEKVPSTISCLEKLEKLDLSNNKLSELPIEITKLARLKELDVSENPLYEKLQNFSGSGVQKVFNFVSGINSSPSEATHLEKDLALSKDDSTVTNLLIEIGIPPDRANKYSMSFVENGLDSSLLEHMNHELLKEVGVDVLGDRLKIINAAKALAKKQAQEVSTPRPSHVKVTNSPSLSKNARSPSSEPWTFPTSFLQKPGWQLRASGTYKSFEVFTENSVNDEEMSDFVKSLFYDFFQGSEFELCKAYAIHNAGLKSIFEQTRMKLERRLQYESSLFGKKSWNNEEEWRSWVLDKLKKKVEEFSHNQEKKVKAIPVLQGLRNPEVAWKIAQTGMAVLSQLDDGYYGNGMYFTSSAEYAIDLYTSPNTQDYRTLIICWILLGNVYPCIEPPAKDSPGSFYGKPLKVPHDAHYVVVEKNGMPCPQFKEPNFDEIVVKEEGQVLPVFVLFVKKR